MEILHKRKYMCGTKYTLLHCCIISQGSVATHLRCGGIFYDSYKFSPDSGHLWSVVILCFPKATWTLSWSTVQRLLFIFFLIFLYFAVAYVYDVVVNKNNVTFGYLIYWRVLASFLAFQFIFSAGIRAFCIDNLYSPHNSRKNRINR